MVKIRILQIEYRLSGKIDKITADVSYASYIRCNKKITRVWNRFCDSYDRKDIIKIKSNRKFYTPIGIIESRAKYEIENQKSREERRLVCKCKEKCKAEFQCEV